MRKKEDKKEYDIKLASGTMGIKAILFDLDNTLIDFMEMKRKATEAAAKAMVAAGLQADEGELAKGLFDFYLEYDIEADDAFLKYLEKTYGEIDYRVLAAAINAYLREKALHLKPYPGVPDTLEKLRLRGYKLGVVSNGRRMKAWMRLNAAGLDGYFDVVIGWEDTGKKKPEPEPFLMALEKLGVLPEECLMVGDWPEIDLAGAKAVGMKTCWAKYGSRFEDGGEADFIIGDIEDLAWVLNEPLWSEKRQS
jgi:HAD superfamily hydrolase (TIGR02253 family)